MSVTPGIKMRFSIVIQKPSTGVGLSPETSYEYLTFPILVLVKYLGNRKHPKRLNICKRITIISVSKSLNSCWGDHVDPSKTQCSLMESAIGLESGNLILLPITYMTLNKSFKL